MAKVVGLMYNNDYGGNRMKLNTDKLVKQSYMGQVHHPTKSGDGYYTGYDGVGHITVGTGGITYNFKIGDNCMDLAGDHVEPGVSLKNANANENNALQLFACVGNIAKVVSGEAKGATGFVTGKHGGVDHVMVYFDEETLDKMIPNDQVLIKGFGTGLKVDGFEDVAIQNVDPDLFEKMVCVKENTIEVKVTHILPSYLMGSGLGSTTLMSGDYDIMTQDKKTIEALGLNQLRFGDIVYISDHDATHGAHYLKGSGVVGVICHSDSYTAGHGPGVTVLMSSPTGKIKPIIDEHANLAEYLLK